MTCQRQSVFCIATNLLQAESIVEQLADAGFSNHDVSVLYPDQSGTHDFAHQHSTKAPEGAAGGAGTGGVLGGRSDGLWVRARSRFPAPDC